MDIKKVYLATRYNTGLKLRAVDALSYAKQCADANYSKRTGIRFTTEREGYFNIVPTEYRRASAWNPQTTIHGRQVRFLENCQDNSSLRFAGFASDIDRNLAQGWYCDNYQNETFKAAVWQLPGKNGEARYLSGYIEPWNDGGLIDCGYGSYYAASGEDHQEAMRAAARDADSMAERFSEAEREYQTKESAKLRIEDCKEEITKAREKHSELITELRALPAISVESPNLCASIRNTLSSLRSEVHNLKKEIQRLTDEPWTINPC